MSSHSTVALLLMPLLILASVGLSTGQSRNNAAYGSPDNEVPWSQQYNSERRDQNDRWKPKAPEPSYLPETEILFQKLDDLERMENKAANHDKFAYPDSSRTYGQSESLQIEHKTHVPSQNSGQETHDPPAGDRRFQQMIATSTPAGPASSCRPHPSTSHPAKAKSPAPKKTHPTVPATSKPSGCKVQPKKCSKKPKLLTPKTAKIILEFILASKRHALSVLKNLNYLEMEILSQSSECPLPNVEREQPQPKKKPKKPLSTSSWTHSQAFFGIRPASHKESAADLALAREEERKLERRVWEEHQQQLEAMQLIKPRMFQMAPPAAVRLEVAREPQVPHKLLQQAVKPLKRLPYQDPIAIWNPEFLSKADINAIRVEPEDSLQTENMKKDQRKAGLFH